MTKTRFYFHFPFYLRDKLTWLVDWPSWQVMQNFGKKRNGQMKSSPSTDTHTHTHAEKRKVPTKKQK